LAKKQCDLGVDSYQDIASAMPSKSLRIIGFTRCPPRAYTAALKDVPELGLEKTHAQIKKGGSKAAPQKLSPC